MMKNTLQKLALVILSILTTFSTPVSALSGSRLQIFAQNNILFYNPEGGPRNYCTSGGDCYITGTTHDEKLWSALRHVGFTPEQTAGVIGNIVHEGGSPTRQEDCYNIARDKGYTTQEGKTYDIHLDNTNGAHHGSGIQTIDGCSSYKAGGEVAGIGIGFVGWTSHDRREGYLEKVSELGLSKYFEGDAYKTYGRYTDDQLKEAIISETGSDSDYWALWCAAIKFIWTEMNSDDYNSFFEQTSVHDYAAYTATWYERCYYCQPGDSSFNERVASAEEYYNRYNSGEFSAIENGSAPSATGSSTQNTGANVTIIGDSITNGSRSAISALLPDANIIAQDSKQLIGTNSSNPSGVQVINDLNSSNSLRDIVVIALGTNNYSPSLTNANIESVIDAIGPSRKVIFVTNYDIIYTTRYDENNAVFSAATDIYDNVSVIDWKAAILGASGDLTDYIKDESTTSNYAVHPTTAGAELLAQLISNAVNGIKVSETCRNVITDVEFYYQSDEPWGSLAYGNCGDDSTIGSSGCGPTSLAMVITALTGYRVTPDEVASKAVAAGYRACGNGSYHTITNLATDYGLVVKDYGNPSIEEISTLLSQGVMFHVAGSGPSPYTSGGHFIAIRGITPEGKWLIFDSAHKGSDNNTKEWDPSDIYPNTHSDWRGVSRN